MSLSQPTEISAKALLSQLASPLPSIPGMRQIVLNPVHEIDACLHEMEQGADRVRSWFFIFIAAIGGLRDIERLNNGDELDFSRYVACRRLRTSGASPCATLLDAMTRCDSLAVMREMLETFEIIARDALVASDPRCLGLSRMGYVPAPVSRLRH